ncbi:N-acetylglucosaminyl-diphospho-decaprenol L-rhamnosyltransferase [Sporomusa ovata DSM 2662]|uniref:Glycosyltransferase n=1 Tax=Sporomusa ovata TaxID=2378 RepID=A0A0U1KV55_9FIRM|nr:glycosyltransferase [Sporomusa ovata]EQB27114.1 glycosyl transferase family 2 [Sporomusa ovata DSM 2662]CQR71216.1 Glycosyltransferase [Sporomusa ovata]
MKTSIVILTFNQLEYTKKCIDSIRQYTKKNEYEIIIVDNNSTDGTNSWLKEQHDIKTIFNKENVGFPKGCNQGIAVSTGDNILLLNNDVIVTSNWLDNLVQCLYSQNEIGAVGPITNNVSNYQAISVNYHSETEMQLFAETVNKFNPKLWEERLKLVGFCLLIKRSVLEQVGLLDEQFSPGNFEDDDLSYRIRLAGFRLILCKDTFIHHFGSVSFKQDNSRYAALLKENGNKFADKWGFDSSYFSLIRFEVAALADSPEDIPLTILEVGCACGGTLLHLKNKYKKASLYGIEINKAAARSAALFAEVSDQNIEELELAYPQNFFDYILLTDVLEHLQNPWMALTTFKQYLKPYGKLLVSIPNVMHFSVIKKMLQGCWTYEAAGILDKTPLHFFTLYEIDKTFKELGYCVQEYRMTTSPETEQDSDFIKKVTQLMGDPNLAQQYRANQYIFAAKLKPPISLVFLLRRIEHDIDKAQTLNTLMEFIESGVFSTNDIIQVTENDMVKKEELLQTIAVCCYEHKLTESALTLLENAYQRDKQDPITAYHLACILSKTGKTEVALGLLNQLKQKDAKILELIAKIKEVLHESK